VLATNYKLCGISIYRRNSEGQVDEQLTYTSVQSMASFNLYCCTKWPFAIFLLFYRTTALATSQKFQDNF